MPPMAQQQQQQDDLTTLTLDAVKALLRTIATGGHSFPGSGSGPAHGTYASFSAQALRDLMQCEPLADIVKHAVNEELTSAGKRG